MFQQELDDAVPAEFASPGKSINEFSAGGRRLQTASVVKEALHDIQTAHSGPAFQVQARAAIRQILGRFASAVVQTGVHHAARVRSIDPRTTLDQQLHERELNACGVRVVTGSSQPQGGRSSAVRLDSALTSAPASNRSLATSTMFLGVFWRKSSTPFVET